MDNLRYYPQMCRVTILRPSFMTDVPKDPPELQTLFRIIIHQVKMADNIVNEAAKSRLPYSSSPAFEVGYIVAEVQDKYMRMINLYRRTKRNYWQGYNAAQTIEAYETIERLRIEIVHFERMVHEVELKYSHSLGGNDDSVLLNSMLHLEEQKKLIRERQERAKKIEKWKRQQNLIDYYRKQSTTRRRKVRWDYDYGWEPERYNGK